MSKTMRLRGRDYEVGISRDRKEDVVIRVPRVGLCQLFNIFHLVIKDAFEEDLVILLVKLDLEKTRLLIWGNAIGVLKVEGDGCAMVRPDDWLETNCGDLHDGPKRLADLAEAIEAHERENNAIMVQWEVIDKRLFELEQKDSDHNPTDPLRLAGDRVCLRHIIPNARLLGF